MKILFSQDNLLPKAKKKNLKNIQLTDIFIPGGYPVIWLAKKVGLQIGNKVRLFRDDKEHTLHLRAKTISLKEFLK
jgi:hypothetical protein